MCVCRWDDVKDLRTHSEEASAGTDSQSVPSKLNTPPHSGEAVAGPSTLLLETLLSARTGKENQAWPGFALLHVCVAKVMLCRAKHFKGYGPSEALITSAWLLKCIYKKLWKLVPKANPCDLYYLMKEYVEPLENEHQRHTDRQSGLPSRKPVLWK